MHCNPVDKSSCTADILWAQDEATSDCLMSACLVDLLSQHSTQLQRAITCCTENSCMLADSELVCVAARNDGTALLSMLPHTLHEETPIQDGRNGPAVRILLVNVKHIKDWLPHSVQVSQLALLQEVCVPSVVFCMCTSVCILL